MTDRHLWNEDNRDGSKSSVNDEVDSDRQSRLTKTATS
jgi:hypothetical protein